jgi:hypothetical protein
LLEATGTVARGRLARSTIHRLLQPHGLSRISGSASLPEEKRRFIAATAGAIWYGDVMHGPRVPIDGKLAKIYLVSPFDDALECVDIQATPECSAPPSVHRTSAASRPRVTAISRLPMNFRAATRVVALR